MILKFGANQKSNKSLNLFNKTLAFFLISLLISCSPIYGISYDYDRNVDFTNLMTYDWVPVPEKANINRLDIKRIKKMVNSEMQARGLRIAPDNPDFLIAEHLVKKDKINVTDWGYGYGPYGRYRGRGGFSVYQYEEGTLILDLVDTKSKELIWRGAAKADLDGATTPEKRDKLIREAAQKILKNFPPPTS